MKWLEFFGFCLWLPFFFVSASIPHENLPPSPSFEQVFNSMVGLLKDEASKTTFECPYHFAKIILTLSNYHPESSHATFKYKCIYKKLRNSFNRLRTEARWQHISAWEIMINRAITLAIRRKRAKVIEFLDEALIEGNPLGVIGPLQKFSENPVFVKFHYRKSDPILSVTEEYQKMINMSVLQELGRIKASFAVNPNLLNAGLIDLFVLINQHLRSITYCHNEKVFFPALKMIAVAVRFPKVTFDTYYRIVREGDGREDGEIIIKTLSERIRQTDPFAFASYAKIFCENIFDIPFAFKGFKERFSVTLDTQEKTRHDLRLFLASFATTSYISPKLFFRHRVFALYDFDLLKTVDVSFPTLIIELIGRSSAEVLLELENRVKIYLLPSHFMELSVYQLADAGLLHSFKVLLDNDCEFLITFGPCAVEFALQSDHMELAKFLLDRFRPHFVFKKLEKIAKIAAKFGSLEILEVLLLRVQVERRESVFRECLLEAIEGKRFLNVDFILHHCPTIGRWNFFLKNCHELVYNAFEYGLPEAKIREYIRRFGMDLIGYDSCNNILIPATVGGYLNLIEEFNLCSSSADRAKVDAIANAARKHKTLTPAIAYVIDRFLPCFQKYDFPVLVMSLVESCSRAVLQYLIKKHFGAEISPEFKADVLVYLSDSTLEILSHNDRTQSMIVQFCSMMEWTRFQIKFTGEINTSLFGLENQGIVDKWERRCYFLERCLELVTHC